MRGYQVHSLVILQTRTDVCVCVCFLIPTARSASAAPQKFTGPAGRPSAAHQLIFTGSGRENFFMVEQLLHLIKSQACS